MLKTPKFRFTNSEVILILKEALAALEIKEANRFRIRAYQNAIAAIESLTSSVEDLWSNNRLEEIPGVGFALKNHLNELFTTGDILEYKTLKSDLPQGMFSLLGLRGIGAKTAFKLAVAFNLDKRDTALELLKKAAEHGKIKELPGFGEKSEKEILEAVTSSKKQKNEKQRMLLIKGEEVASRVIEYMQKHEKVQEIVALGSLRRRAPTVGDIDFAAATEDPASVIEYFVSFPEVAEILWKGDKKATVVLKNDAQVDLIAIEPESFGSLLQHSTGSKQHNILLRTYALEKGMSLSEHGIKVKNELEKFSSEKDFYARLGLSYIPPELRHGKKEILLAKDNKLPKLVSLSDIKGDIHMHTTFSDGANSIFEMVEQAKSLGYEYVGISDHSPSVSNRGTYEVLGIIEQARRAIEQINSSDDSIRVLFGYEVNILVDNTMSMPNEILEKLDYCIGSIHTGFNKSKLDNTQRLISAIENPYVHIIGHPSTRLINQRDPIDADWEKVFDACVANNTILEINAQPDRLDLPDDLVMDALEKGVKFIINTDAHFKESLLLMQYGIDVARRAGCEASDVINTYSLNEFLKSLK